MAPLAYLLSTQSSTKNGDGQNEPYFSHQTPIRGGETFNTPTNQMPAAE